jgi:hypothetical protein
MVKKLIILGMVTLFIFVLTACGGSDAGSSTEQEEQEEQENEESGTEGTNESLDLSLEELIDNISEAMTDVSSHTEEMLLDITYTSNDPQASGEFKGNGSTETILEPFTVHQKMNMVGTPPGSDEEFNIETKTYMEENMMYTYNSMSKSWMAIEMVDEEMEDLGDNIERLKDFKHILELSATNDSYVLSVNGNNKEIEEFLYSWADESLIGLEEEFKEDFNQELSSSEFNLVIDNKTFRVKSIQYILEMIETRDGEELKVRSEVTVNMTGYNNVSNIVIPEEARNAAQMTMPPNMEGIDMSDFNLEDFEEYMEGVDIQ